VTASMRGILLDWLFEVVNVYRLSRATVMMLVLLLLVLPVLLLLLLPVLLVFLVLTLSSRLADAPHGYDRRPVFVHGADAAE